MKILTQCQMKNLRLKNFDDVKNIIFSINDVCVKAMSGCLVNKKA
jgi:hypothetical protein